MKRSIIITLVAFWVTFHLTAGNKLVGTIDVNATVSESGGAVVSIPIDIPAGINGMQPNLSLVYNSQGGLGIAGWGWDLSGLSSISRTGSDFYHDGKSEGIHVTRADHLLLDGQRLILMTGTYLINNSEYQTEKESFNRIKYLYSNGFEIQAKNGIISKYGDTSNSRLADSNGNVFCWQVSEIRDLNGNYISYQYNPTNAGGLLETSISSIAYTGNGTSVAPAYTVQFIYTTLSHPRTSYVEATSASIGLMTLRRSKLLTQIKVLSGSQELYSYNLSYDNTSGMEPRLNYIQKVAANGDYYDSNVITWNNPNTVTTNESPSMGMSKKEKLLYADFTGNGRTDILSYATNDSMAVLYKNNSSGNSASFSAVTVNLHYEFDYLTALDYNGDGKADLAGTYTTVFGSIFHARCLLGTGAGFTTTNIHKQGSSEKEIVHGDFDGDGRDELIFTHEPTIMYDYIENNVNRTISISGLPTTGLLFKVLAKDKCKLTWDFNGNGRTEILFGDAEDFSIYELQTSNSTTFHEIKSATREELNITGDLDYEKFLIGDFNADGRTDFIYYGYDSNANDGMFEARLYAATASSFDLVRIDLFPSVPTKAFAADCNGDDLPDLLYTFGSSSVGCRVGLNTGNSFTTMSFTWSGMVPADITDSNGINFTDITGDGRADLFCFKNGTSNARVRKIYSGSHHLVSSVQDGLGNTYQFTYKPLSNSSVYTVSDTPSFPYAVFRYPMTVVSALTAPYTNRTYTYKNAYVHKQGKGFLGFKQMTVQDNLNNAKTISSKKLNSTYAYLIPSQTVTKTLNNETISTVTYTDTLFVYNSETKHIWPVIKKTVSTDNLTTLETIEWNQFNGNGNLKKTTITKGGLKTVWSNNYDSDNYYGSWCENKIISRSEYSKLNGVTSAQRTQNYTYNSNGNITVLVEDSLSSLKRRHTYTYDSFGHVTSESVTGSNQTRVTTTSWPSHGRFPSSTTDELGMQTTYSFHSVTGLLTSKVEPGNNTTSYQYDHFGRLKKTTLPDNTIQETTYGWITGNASVKYYVTESTSQAPAVTTYYNAAGKPVLRKTIGFNNRQVFTAYGYNSNGTTAYVSEPFFASSWNEAMGRTFDADSATFYTYDTYGRVLQIHSPSNTEIYTYDGLTTTHWTNEGVYETEVDASGLVTSKTLIEERQHDINIPIDSLRNIVVDTKTINYTYYPTGQVKTITPEGGSTLTLSYDLHGNRISLIDPDAGSITDTYNAFDQPLTHQQNVNNVNITTTYTYASNGLLNSEATDGPEGLTKNYSYHNNLKNLPTRIYYYNTNNETTYSYDTYGRLTGTSQTVGGVTTTEGYGYGSYSLPTSHTHDGVVTENYVYDANGYQTKEQLGSTDVWQLLETNARGQVVREKKSNITTEYTYDKAGRVLSIYAPGIINLSYTYSDKGNMLTKTDSITGQKMTYGYDGKNRLVSWRIQSPLPASSGNGRNSVVDTTFTMTYDSTTGNILTKSDLGADATFNYTPTAKPHALTGISDVADDFLTGSVAVTYTDKGKVKTVSLGNSASYAISYTAQGGRGKSVLTVGNHTQTRYYGDGTEKVYDSLGTSHYLSYLCHGAIVVRNISGSPSVTTLQGYYDAQGSLTALVTPSGTVVRRYAYDPWGNRLDPDDWTQPDTQADTYHINRGYTMHEHLDDFGLINMNGRVFDSATAQFLSPDNYIQSSGNWLNYNRYAYCLNNPLKYTDPSGEVGILVTAAIVGAFSGVINVISHWNQLDNVWDWMAAFGIGFTAGAVGAVTGGLAFAAAGGISGGFLAGAVGGAVSAAYSMPIQSAGNTAYFGDPMLSGTDYFKGILCGAAIGGVINGTIAGKNGRNFWTGDEVAPGRNIFSLNNSPIKSEIPLYTEPAGIDYYNSSYQDISEIKIPEKLSYYTADDPTNWTSIGYLEDGEIYLTSDSELGRVSAINDLSLSKMPNYRIDITTTGNSSYDASKVMLVRRVNGNVYNQGGGGWEVIYKGIIKLDSSTKIGIYRLP